MNRDVLDPSFVYDPRTDAFTNWHDWEFRTVRLGPGEEERFYPDRRLVLLDRAWVEADPDFAYAHVLGHLRLGHHDEASGAFTPGHERHANYVAQVRLDREGSRL